MRSLLRAAGLPLWLAVTACQGGVLGEPGAGPGLAAAGSAGTPGSGGSGPGAIDCQSGPVQGYSYLRRLTNAEYRASVQQLLGTTSDPTTSFPPDSLARGFSNNSEAIAISTLHAERYASAAELLASEAFGDEARRSALVGCDLTAAGCLTQFIDRFGALAFRRPLRPEEQAAFVKDAMAGLSPKCPDCGALGSLEEVDGEVRCIDCDLVVGAKTKLAGFGRR